MDERSFDQELLRALRGGRERSLRELAGVIGEPHTSFGRPLTARLHQPIERLLTAGLVEEHAHRYRLASPATQPIAAHAAPSAARGLLDRLAARFPGGPQGNRHLTALLGAVLLAGILVELATLLLGLQHTLTIHIAVGVALIPLVLLKLASTGWRMIRYYTHSPAYRAEGPPRPLLRGIAPLVVGATLALLGSGVGLVIAGPQAHFFRALHSASFAIFLLVVGTHALAHLPKLRRFAFADWARGRRARGHALRRTLVGFALVAGGSLAIAAAQDIGPWLHAIHHGVGG
jgi:hypothetical protein